jgi:DegV family protein with EDD domain
MAFAIVTDSSCNLPEGIIDAHELSILPLTFMVDDVQYTSYLKGQVTNLKQFYTMLRQGKVITTSLPNVAESAALVEDLLVRGIDVLYLGFSSALSGTFESTDQIMREAAAYHPERTLVSVETLAASGGQGMLVLYAAEMREQGKSIGETAEWVRANRLRMAHWFTVDDLMFLYRGGRVSRTSAKAGTVLNIKPVMHVDDEGRLIPVSKVRGRKRSIHAMLDHMEESYDPSYGPQHICITHGDCAEDAEYLAGLIRGKFEVRDITINYVDPVIGAHSGPGTLALFFLGVSRG